MNIYDSRIEMVEALIPKNKIIAELGVFQGTFMKELHKRLEPKKLVAVDLFSGLMTSGDEHGNDPIEISLDEAYNNLLKYTELYQEIELIKGYSEETIAKYPDNYFDMIYVDADHSYYGCKRDLEICYKKIKPNGWLMGHDYEMNMNKAKYNYWFGVTDAVNEFCNEYNQKITAKGNDGCVSFGIKISK